MLVTERDEQPTVNPKDPPLKFAALVWDPLTYN